MREGILILRIRKGSDFVENTEKKVQWLKLLFPWILVLAVYALVWLFLGVRYEVNDDATLCNIAAGAYGEESQYLIYINILIGYILKPLYWIAPSINWLYFIQTGADVAALAVLCQMLLDRCGYRRGSVLSGLLLLLVGVDLFYSFQYVKNSGLYLIVGLALMAQHLGRWDRGTFWGTFWVLLGSMVRFQNFPAVGGMAAALLLLRFFSLDLSSKKKAVAAMVLMFFLVGAVKGVDILAYRMDDGWKAYTEYNAARTEISDFRLQYVTAEEMSSFGYSANDYDTLHSWSFWDDNVFNTQALEELAQKLPKNGLLSAAKDAVHYCLTILQDNAPFHLLLSGVVLLWLFYGRKKGSWAFIATGVLYVCMVYYLALRGRYPHRVEFVLVVAAAIFALLCCDWQGRERKIPIKVLCFFAVGILIVCSPYLKERHDFMEGYRSGRQPRAEYTEYSQDKEHLYLVDVDALDALAGYDVLHPREKNFFSNIVVMGGWLSHAPHRVEALAQYGVENPYLDMIDNDTVYLIDYYNVSAKEVYLKEHYGLNVEREMLREEQFNLYQMHSVTDIESEN